MREYPKWIFHATENPRMVKSEDEEISYLDKGWSTVYIPQSTPKYVPPKAAEPAPEEPAAPAKKK